jgi:acetylornithine deacetylase/succinyl-diaminopimelate desuccinylase-like protein
MTAAGTDAKRVAPLGIKVYGFAPATFDGPDALKGIHGHDERISVRSVQWGVRVLYDVVEQFCT